MKPRHATLIVSQGRQAGKVIRITGRFFLIGRDPRCHLRPISPAVSRHHCALLIEEDRVVVRDLRSRTGTFVNDELVCGEVELRSGDQLRVGPVAFAFWLGNRVMVDEPEANAANAFPQSEVTNEEQLASEVLLAESNESSADANRYQAASTTLADSASSSTTATELTQPVSRTAGRARSPDDCEAANYQMSRRQLPSNPALAATAILWKYRRRPDARRPDAKK